MKQNINFFVTLVALAVIFISFVPVTRAVVVEPCPPPSTQGNCPPGQCLVGGKCQLANPAPGQLVDTPDFQTLLANFISIFLYFAGGIATLFLIIGGYRYVVGSGNEEATEKAKKTITSAVIGIVIIVMAFAIVMIINTLLTQTAENQVTVIPPAILDF